jgi:hypothetical protein
MAMKQTMNRTSITTHVPGTVLIEIMGKSVIANGGYMITRSNAQ